MTLNPWQIGVLSALCLGIVPLRAATVSRQHAEAFAQKMVLIERQAAAEPRSVPRRTSLTQDEVNSWFAFRSPELFPAGVSQPEVVIPGGGVVIGRAVLDLEAIGKRRASGGTVDPWSLLGGRVPVRVSGILHSENGRGRFELQEAEMAGIPVPAALVQEIVSAYFRTPEQPEGVRLDAPFALPANIREIEVGQGLAVVVQ